MNCGTFVIPRIERAVAEVLRTFEEKNCASCGNPLFELDLHHDAYHCKGCGAAVCVICGCTDDVACEGGCSWLGPGICSTHGRELDAALERNGIQLTTGY